MNGDPRSPQHSTTTGMEPPENAVDIGDGHRIVYVDYEGEPAGVSDYHQKADGTWCGGWVTFAGSAWARQFPNAPHWHVVSADPLTLAPSLLCRSCGDHGFIRDGRWVKA